jgi:hypothetical protein
MVYDLGGIGFGHQVSAFGSLKRKGRRPSAPLVDVVRHNFTGKTFSFVLAANFSLLTTDT